MDLVVGNKDCSFQDVCDGMLDSPTSSLLHQKWKDLAHRLSLSDEICKLETKIYPSSLSSTLFDILSAWRGRMAQEATLSKLIDALENCKLIDIAGFLKLKFKVIGHNASSNDFRCGPEGMCTILNRECKIVVISTSVPSVTYNRIRDTTPTDFKISDLIPYNTNHSLEMHVVENEITVVSTDNAATFLQYWEHRGNLVILTQEFAAHLRRKLLHNNDLKIFSDNIKWSDLTVSFQNKILMNSDLLKKVDKQFLEMNLNGNILIYLIDKYTNKSFSNPFPEISYYISRRLSARKFISTQIFSGAQHKNNVYVVTGMQEHDIVPFLNNCRVDTTKNQMSQNELTVNHIIIETESDFDKLIDKTDKPIHLLHGTYIKDKWELIWKRSSGSLDEIRRYVEEKMYTYSEATFFENVEAKRYPVIITGEPGMGKSIFGGRIFQTLSRHNKIVIFISCRELLNYIDARFNVITFQNKDIVDVICSIRSHNQIGKQILQLLFDCKTEPIEIVFDGLDEIQNENLGLMFACFHYLNDTYASVRLWITTRPHLLNKLESEFNTLGYHLLPFHKNDRIDFFVANWKHQFTQCIENERNLRFYASTLNTFIEECMMFGNTDEDIGSIPLQCFMIASIYENGAKGHAKLVNIAPAPEIENLPFHSVATLYQAMIEQSYKNYFKDKEGIASKITEIDLDNAHAYRSVELLFPSYLSELKPYIRYNELLTLNKNEINKVGLLQLVGENSLPAFVHQTFAEYFIAKFSSKVLKSTYHQAPAKVFTSEIPTNKFSKIPIYESNNWNTCRHTAEVIDCSFICYAVEYCDHVAGKKLRIESRPEIKIVEHLAMACIIHAGFFTLKILGQLYKRAPLKNLDFDERMSVVLTSYGDFSAAKFALNEFADISPLGRRGLNKNINHNLLNLAASRGDFNVFEYLLQQPKFVQWLERANNTLLIHACVENSICNNSKMVDGKVKIILSLHDIRKTLIEEKDHSGQPAILCKNVHFQLLCTLIILNANLETETGFETLLHKAVKYLSEDNFYRLVKLISEQHPRVLITLLKTKNRLGETPLQTALRFSNPKQEVIQYFSKSDADFKNVDMYDNCILSTAIKYGKCTNLNILVEKGADLYRVNKIGHTLLHIATINSNLNAIKILLEMNLNVNILNIDKETALHIAVVSNHSQAANVVSYLCKNGADISICNKSCDDVLQSALRNGSLKTVESLLDEDYCKCLSSEEFAGKIVYFAAKYSKFDMIKFVCIRFLTFSQTPSVSLADIDVGHETSILHAAVQNAESTEIVKYFLESHGFQLILKRPMMQNLLHVLVTSREREKCSERTINNAIETMELLFRHGDKKSLLQHRDNQGRNPLLAYNGGNVKLAMYMIENGADINVVDKNGNCFLNHAKTLMSKEAYKAFKIKTGLQEQKLNGLCGIVFAKNRTIAQTKNVCD